MTSGPNSVQAAASSSQVSLPRSAVRVLAASAGSGQLGPELGTPDWLAQGLFQDLGGDFGAFDRGELRCAAFRTSVVDELGRGFFERNPSGLGVSLWPLLGTRSHRFSANPWLDVDAPPIAALRRRYLPEREGWTQLASCLCSVGNTAADFIARGPCLFVLDESVLPLSPSTMVRVLDSLAAYARPGSELLIAFDGHAQLRATSGQGRAVVELELEGGFVRYPGLCYVDDANYPEGLQASLAGINAVSQLQQGQAPALAHLALR